MIMYGPLPLHFFDTSADIRWQKFSHTLQRALAALALESTLVCGSGAFPALRVRLSMWVPVGCRLFSAL